MNNYFFYVVFGLEINNDTYDFVLEEYKEKGWKNFYQFMFTISNAILMIIFWMVFIFCELPVVVKRIGKCCKKERFSEFKQNLENNNESFDINERFTTDIV